MWMVKAIFLVFSITGLHSKNPYYGTIARYCKKHDLKVKIIYYQCLVENGTFNPKRKSHKDAYGIMQITVPNFRFFWKKQHKYKCPLTDKTIIEILKVPEYNIMVGCWYMRYLLDRYDQNYIQALSKYNMGHNNAKDNLSYANKILMYVINTIKEEDKSEEL
jgi:soluble lytic murein transglycosylase